MNRRKADLQSIDLSQWPTAAYRELDPTEKAAFQIRMLAVQQYATGDPLQASNSRTGSTAASFIDGLNERLPNTTTGESMIIAD